MNKITLNPGHNFIRIITQPFLYLSHIDEADCSMFYGSCNYCGQAVEAKLAGNATTNKLKQRWIVGIIDRVHNRTNALDIDEKIYYQIQILSRMEEWGNPSGYEISLYKDYEDAFEPNEFKVIPLRKVPLSDSDIELKSKFNLDQLSEYSRPKPIKQ